jgi:hypothetical protein
MEIIRTPITKKDLAERYSTCFSTMSKAVVDVERGVMSLDAELHSDEEAQLLEDGSSQENLWGINLYPSQSGSEFIQYTSLINIRPHQNNPGMEVSIPGLRETIESIVRKLVPDAS